MLIKQINNFIIFIQANSSDKALDNDNYSPLHWACYKGQFGIAHYDTYNEFIKLLISWHYIAFIVLVCH